MIFALQKHFEACLRGAPANTCSQSVFSSNHLLALLLVLCSQGCLTDRVDLVESGIVETKFVDSQRTEVSRVSAYVEREEFVVSGRVRATGTSTRAGNGHVDVILFDDDGDVIEFKEARYIPASFRRGQSASFTARFSGVNGEPKTIHVAHHASWFH